MHKKALHPQDIIQKMAVHVSMCMQTKCQQMQKNMESCKTYLLCELMRVLHYKWTSAVENERHWGNKLMYIFFTTQIATVKSATLFFPAQHNHHHYQNEIRCTASGCDAHVNFGRCSDNVKKNVWTTFHHFAWEQTVTQTLKWVVKRPELYLWNMHFTQWTESEKTNNLKSSQHGPKEGKLACEIVFSLWVGS